MKRDIERLIERHVWSMIPSKSKIADPKLWKCEELVDESRFPLLLNDQEYWVNKTWQDADEAYRRTVAHYASHPYLAVFKKYAVKFVLLNMSLIDQNSPQALTALRFYIDEAIRNQSPLSKEHYLALLTRVQSLCTESQMQAQTALMIQHIEQENQQLQQQLVDLQTGRRQPKNDMERRMWKWFKPARQEGIAKQMAKNEEYIQQFRELITPKINV